MPVGAGGANQPNRPVGSLRVTQEGEPAGMPAPAARRPVLSTGRTGLCDPLAPGRLRGTVRMLVYPSWFGMGLAVRRQPVAVRSLRRALR